MAEQLIVSSAVHSFMQSADTNAMKTLVVDGASQLNLGASGNINVSASNVVHTGTAGNIAAAATNAVHMGYSGSVFGENGVHMGDSGTASGTSSVHMGIGGEAARYAQIAIGGKWGRQFSIVQMDGFGTTSLDMTLLDGSDFTFVDDRLYSIQIDLTARTDVNTAWFHTSKYTASFVNNTGTTTQIGTTTVLSTETTNGQSPTVNVTAAGNILQISCIPYNAYNTMWYAVLQVTEQPIS